MTLALRRFGVAVEPYVPSRLEEGHGLSLAALDAAAAGGCTRHRDRRLRLDERRRDRRGATRAGSTSSSPTTIACRRSCPPPSPSSTRIGPTRPTRTAAWRGAASRSRSPSCCSRDEPGGPLAALDLADLATIGRSPTWPRSSARTGRSPGSGSSGCDARRGPASPRSSSGPASQPAAVDLETVAFAIAPAAQRRRPGGGGPRGGAAPAGRRTRPRRRVHADALEAANLTRRDLMKSAVAEARAVVAESTPAGATIVRGPWSVGIVGLVAARLAEDRGRPAVVGADLGDVVRASCRSDGSLDLGAALERCADLFIRFGGHAGAAGFELADRALGRVPGALPGHRRPRRSRPTRG